MSSKGFTLIELMVVLVIVGILATLAIANYDTWRVTAYRGEAKNALGFMAKLQEVYRIENGKYHNPASTEKLHDTLKYNTGVAPTTAGGNCKGNKLGFKLKKCGETVEAGGPKYEYYVKTSLSSDDGYVLVAQSSKASLGLTACANPTSTHESGNYTASGGTQTTLPNSVVGSTRNKDSLVLSDVGKVITYVDLLENC